MRYILLTFFIALSIPTRESIQDPAYIQWAMELMQKQHELELKKQKLLRAVMWIETRNGKIVETHSSRREKAVGLLQIRPGMVEYINKYGHSFTLLDRKDSLRSVEMFFTFQDLKNPEYDLEYGCHIWNAGPYRVESRWHLTENYRTKALAYVQKLHGVL